MLHGYRQIYSLNKKEDINVQIAKYVETRFDISNYELDRPLLKIKNKKVIGLMKDELCGKIITEFPESRPKTYSYLKDDNNKNKNKKLKTKKIKIKT